MAIIADTGGLIVLIDKSHSLHEAAKELLQKEPLLIPESVLPEFDYLVSKRFGGKVAQMLFKDLISGYFHYSEITLADLKRAQEIRELFGDTDIGYVDASIVALAERLLIRQILTTDKRHFSMFRPKGLGYLEMLP